MISTGCSAWADVRATMANARLAANRAARIALLAPRIDVPGVCCVRQRREPVGDLGGAAPCAELLAFAKRRRKARVAERSTALDSRQPDRALNSRELERQRRNATRQAAKRFRLEPFDVEL